MADERPPWERMEDEPNRWYQRFNAFRLMGPNRSLLGAVNAERVKKSQRESNQLPGSWRKAADEWHWRARAAAWDQHLTKLAEAEVEAKWRAQIMGPNEVLGRLSEHGRVSIGDFLITKEVPVLLPNGSPAIDPDTKEPVMRETWDIDLKAVKANGRLVKSIAATRYGPKIEMWGENPALVSLGNHHQVFNRQGDDQGQDRTAFALPARVIAPSFLDVYDDIQAHAHTEYVLEGGRGSTKSSFISLSIVELLRNNPSVHALVTRQVADTLRASTYSQIEWAIRELGLNDQFKLTTNPLEIVYKPTGQRIYFRGADDPGKIKSIKPPFGYIGILWLEELDQFHGPEAVRNIEQSAIRGGDVAWIFKSFNPPKSAANWANKYIKIPKANQYHHHSTYLDLGSRTRWLGQPWLDEAEHLKALNPRAYEHEYLGIPTGTGGLVFDNVTLRQITDEEIKQFERHLFGLDFGFFPDPLHWLKMCYSPATMTLYIFDELRALKMKNRQLYEALTKDKGMTPADLMIADSEDPKSIADLGDYGLSVRGAEKGPGSLDYSMKWLQSLREIVIDPERCPYAAEEFTNYELEQDKNGDFISAYPDKNDHAIAAARYGTNLIWRRRGQ